MPVRLDVDVSGMDACAQKGVAALRDPTRQVPTTDFLISPDLSGALDDVITQYWNNAGDEHRRRSSPSSWRRSRAPAERPGRPGPHPGDRPQREVARGDDRRPATATARPPRRRVRHLAACLALLPTALVVLVVYVGCMLWTVRLSFTSSKLLPVLRLGRPAAVPAPVRQRPLPGLGREHRHLRRALSSRAALVIGFLLAVFIDQQVRGRGRVPHHLPLSLRDVASSSPGSPGSGSSTPTLGLQKLVRDLGFPGFTFDWIVNQRDGGLHARHRRACGTPPGLVMAILLAGPARHRRRPVEGRPRRRHPDLAGLPVDRAAAPGPDGRHRHRAARDRRWPGSTTSSSP